MINFLKSVTQETVPCWYKSNQSVVYLFGRYRILSFILSLLSPLESLVSSFLTSMEMPGGACFKPKDAHVIDHLRRKNGRIPLVGGLDDLIPVIQNSCSLSILW